MSTSRCGAGRRSPESRQCCSPMGGASMRWPNNETGRASMRDRRPKPTRLKLLTGNPGKRPLKEDEPRPEPAVPECPPELSPLARQEWDRLTGELDALRMLTN